ncbi:MAG TPA: ATP-binding protein, partial [Chloroflexota bacterium]|nr:ATP-binding protein [Chloroflexota bacterium]
TRDESFLSPYVDAVGQFDRQLAVLRRAVDDEPLQQARLHRVEQIMREWQQVVAQPMIALTRSGRDAGALVRSGAGKRRTDAVRALMDDFIAQERQVLASYERQDASERTGARWVFLGSMSVAILASLVAIGVASQTARQITALADAANGIASGDLNTQLVVQGQDELSRTANAFNIMASSVREAQERLMMMNAALERQANAEREANRVKDEFISLVSHELRTPLTSIKGYVDLLLDGEVGEIGEEQREFLTIVKNNADREVALVNDLLDISRIEAGKVELLRTAVDLGALVDGVARGLRPQMEAKGQQLHLNIPEDLPAVDGDANRISQILTNLIGNAHKYTPANGHITVAAKQYDSEVQLDVRDTGVGLTPEEQTHLFQKFYRAKNRATQEVGGTGLGLAITRQLVHLHGGEIWVKSTPGEGSTFSFTLPVASGGQRPEALPSNDGTAHVGAQLLVIDDEADIAQMIRRYLVREGYGVRLARTLAEGLHIVRTDPPDLILLDVLLPDGDGHELLAMLKADPLTEHIPVIMLSIVSDQGRWREAGATGYLTKPVKGPVIAERVRQVLSSTARPKAPAVDAVAHGMAE